ncbi:regulator of nucleoside diphosphate kinase [Cupriavidus metallidurans]|jgi:regulator of nucleoside diphosphate kinase|uniref:Regulator of nucleoside diphosphate kinase n=2 Tax=Cupriavidus metallidurans TaxID=119219 RepID=Q1LHP9_CUPMC|nr:MULTISPECIES: nucleoside diphosphate kinase regulator [Cupriavidus]PCH56413.1 MAG: transcription elongation factor GreAB [Burkholderiaceae bacterium]ABF10327.1 regulator of nucleoside diphosphate kinase [Cupriavidus metallidurans CH34]AVA37388.1 nucleoside diphosphate kinase regulator [Cupriavidus metallidurans]KWR84517.1 transcription elongation factor GreAB [Cupriavidus sp. SHE]KWW33708.1 Regulator of nucleoside diphosphate kinase [Cupriavidus metallidurans]
MAKTKNTTAAPSRPATLYLTELDVTRLEGIASRAGTAELDEMLDALLERAAIVSPDAIPKDVVTMNSRVVCALEGEAKPRDWTLVYPDDADLATGRLSVLSPIGQALLGARSGDTVDYRLPDGRAQRVTIVEIAFQPEASGQFTL